MAHAGANLKDFIPDGEGDAREERESGFRKPTGPGANFEDIQDGPEAKDGEGSDVAIEKAVELSDDERALGRTPFTDQHGDRLDAEEVDEATGPDFPESESVNGRVADRSTPERRVEGRGDGPAEAAVDPGENDPKPEPVSTDDDGDTGSVVAGFDEDTSEFVPPDEDPEPDPDKGTFGGSSADGTAGQDFVPEDEDTPPAEVREETDPGADDDE